MSLRPRVLFIARWYPVRMDSMLGLFVVRHAIAVSRFADVTVINVSSDHTLINNYDIEVNTENNINSVIIYYKKSNNAFINLYRNIRSWFKALKIYINNSGLPDIVHIHVLSRTAVPAIYLKLFYNIPYLITEHWSRYMPQNVAKGSYKGFFRKLFTKWAVSGAYAVTTVTGHLKNAMKKLGLENNYIIVPNCIDTDKFVPAEKIDSNKKIILHVSCFEEVSKNITGLVNTTELLLKKRNDFEVWLVGDGVDRKNTEEYVTTKKLNQYIKFKGLLEGEDLIKSMQRATFQVLFSNYESQPSVIIESFSCGKPFIATRVGGIPEIIDDTRGVMVEAGDEFAFANAMNDMLDNYIKFDPVKLRSYAIEKFSYEKVGRQFYDIYKNMLSKK